MTRQTEKKYLKRIIGILLLLAVVFICAFFVQDTVANLDNADYRTLKCFYMEEPDSLDAVIMGASEVVNGYSAAEAYKVAGFTSYPFAFSVNSVLLWKYELKEIEKRQHPKVLLIEINGSVYDKKELHSRYCINNFLESMPASQNKLEATMELSDNLIERFLPIVKYHYKWRNLIRLPSNTNLLLHREGHAKLRGVYSFTYRDDFKQEEESPSHDMASPLNEEAEQALRDFLEQCKSSEIEHIVFLEYPHVLAGENMYNRQLRVNKAAEIIKEAGFDYIDLNSEFDNMGLDPQMDFHDPDHMLACGQKKVTHHIANLLSEKYIGQPRKQSEKNRHEWDESAELITKYYDLSNHYLELNKGREDNPSRPRLYEDCKTMDELK